MSSVFIFSDGGTRGSSEGKLDKMSRHAAEDAEKRMGVVSTGVVAEAIGLSVVAQGKAEGRIGRENGGRLIVKRYTEDWKSIVKRTNHGKPDKQENKASEVNSSMNRG